MLTFFLFPVCSTVGVHIARKIDKLGMWSSDTAEVFFDDVHVPCKNVIGQEGMGFTYQMLQFQEERLWAVANSKSTLLSEAYLTYYSKDMMSSKVYFHPFSPTSASYGFYWKFAQFMHYFSFTFSFQINEEFRTHSSSHL